MSKRKAYVALRVLGLLLCLGYGHVLSVSFVFATAATITINLSTLDALDLMPNQFGAVSQTVGVVTDNYTGYVATLNNSNNVTDLVNTEDNSLVIPTIVLPGGNSSVTLNDFPNGYGVSTDGINYTPAPSLNSSIVLGNSAVAGSGSHTLTFGAKPAIGTMTGSYTKSFVIEVVVNNPQYSVVYNQNTVDTVTNMPSNVNAAISSAGAMIIPDTIPVRSNYDFLGWDENASATTATYVAGDTITLDPTQANSTSLYAVWQLKTYTVTLNLDGGSASESEIYVHYQQPYGTIPTPTKQNHTFLGWYKESNFVNEVTASSTVDVASDHTIYAKWVQNPHINDVTTATMTQSAAAAYYGKIVSTVGGTSFNPNADDSRTWRVFYIDTENKYGDGKGTIYLKADNDSNKKIRFNTVNGATDNGAYTSVFAADNIARSINGTVTTSTVSKTRYYRITNNKVVNSSGATINTKYLALNPTYATGRISYSNTYTSAATFFNMEKAAAYLCDPSMFSSYPDSRTNYAIGSPTVEMYIDSWNAKYPNNQMNYRFNTQVDGTDGSQKLPGYQLYPSSTNGWGTATPNVDINTLDTTGMYKTTSGLWFASPSIIYKGGSLIRLSNSSTIGIGNATINMFYEFSPIVSLKSSTFVRTTDY